MSTFKDELQAKIKYYEDVVLPREKQENQDSLIKKLKEQIINAAEKGKHGLTIMSSSEEEIKLYKDAFPDLKITITSYNIAPRSKVIEFEW